ncbi:hypothetical protein [Catenuloplanes atrovinosus]|uniref:Uncharacterized protein HemX n=1 Tax=Catenuloplanes atrovinosus TaxID=137266 RepID=A0AAE4C9U3_9ACTN|nr:hypothetical protein [Catenuloplanes atrovinosus]MDR7276911.1 uncharacterized protein HemX [Catenuloplanes atrovinosus]
MSYPSYGPEGNPYPPQAGPAPAYPQPAPVPPPTSAPPPLGLSPTSGPPPFGLPPADSPMGITTLLLAVACFLLLVLAGAGFGLYVNERGTVSDTRAQLQERDAQAAEAERRVKDMEAARAAAEDELSDVTEQRDVLMPCMRRAQEIFDALRGDDDDKLATALELGDAACAKAEDVVDS